MRRLICSKSSPMGAVLCRSSVKSCTPHSQARMVGARNFKSAKARSDAEMEKRRATTVVYRRAGERGRSETIRGFSGSYVSKTRRAAATNRVLETNGVVWRDRGCDADLSATERPLPSHRAPQNTDATPHFGPLSCSGCREARTLART